MNLGEQVLLANLRAPSALRIRSYFVISDKTCDKAFLQSILPDDELVVDLVESGVLVHDTDIPCTPRDVDCKSKGPSIFLSFPILRRGYMFTIAALSD